MKSEKDICPSDKHITGFLYWGKLHHREIYLMKDEYDLWFGLILGKGNPRVTKKYIRENLALDKAKESVEIMKKKNNQQRIKINKKFIKMTDKIKNTIKKFEERKK